MILIIRKPPPQQQNNPNIFSFFEIQKRNVVFSFSELGNQLRIISRGRDPLYFSFFLLFSYY